MEEVRVLAESISVRLDALTDLLLPCELILPVIIFVVSLG